MEYSVTPTAKHGSQEVIIQDRPTIPLLAAQGDLVKAMQQAVAPFCFSISPTAQGVQITGDEVGVMIASGIINQVVDARTSNAPTDMSSLVDIISSVTANTLKRDLVFRLKGLSYPVTPMSLSQVAFMQTLLSPAEQFLIGVGPTGTGKTHLAIAAALNQLAEGRVKRIIITKPHVVMEGEIVTPTTRQDLEYDSQFEFFEDIFRDLISYQVFDQLKEERKLELIPLGHIRGRTFNDAFIILDEAQNMTVRKMRMAVTRIGRSSRMVVTGDPTHVDLRDDGPSGLVHLLSLLQGADLAKIHHFENNQIIRNSLVARLETLYAEHQ